MNLGCYLGLIIVLGLVVSGQADSSTNGTLPCQSASGYRCKKCYNDYVCQQCQYGARCCPKYCSSCTNNITCTACQNGFKKQQSMRYTYCVNNDSSVDPNRDKNNQRQCQQGYFFHSTLNFCEKCPILYCQKCYSYSYSSSSCIKCFQGYTLENGKCIFIPKQNLPLNITNDSNDNDTENKNKNLSFDINAATTNTNTQEDQGLLYIFFFVLGSVLGFCLACILMKLYFCIKRRCQSLYRRFKNRSKNKQSKNLIKAQKQQMQENYDTLNETQKPNDEQKQSTDFNGFTRQSTKLEMDNISNITYNKSINRSIITEGKN